jgi:N-acetylglutamate synthase-like GNAT family acetyltransferase
VKNCTFIKGARAKDSAVIGDSFYLILLTKNQKGVDISMIREAVRNDKEQLFILYKMLVPHSKKMNVQEEQIDKIRRDPNNFLLVYDEQGEILGIVTLNICIQALHGFRPYGVIENIIVHENHRSKNIGQELLQYVEEYCKSIDCHRIMLLSSSKRQKAHQFFEREGFDGSVSRGFKKYL